MGWTPSYFQPMQWKRTALPSKPLPAAAQAIMEEDELKTQEKGSD